MKFLILLSLITVVLTGCSSNGSNTSNAGTAGTPEPKVVYTGGGLKQLKELAGKRVRQVELWDAADMNDRLGKLVGQEYATMKDDWLIESPILVEGDTLMAAGCEMNNCEKNQWVLFADVANDNVNVYHIKDGAMKLFKEKGEIKVPDAFTGEFNRMKSVQGVK